MLVRDVMKGEVLSISPFVTLADAAKILLDEDVKYLVVMQGNDIQGILSFTDLEQVSEDARNYIKITDKMTHTPVCISGSAELLEAERLIRESGIKALPVCDGQTLIGIITAADIQEIFSRQSF